MVQRKGVVVKLYLLDIPVLIVAGSICGYLYSKVLIKRNKDWYAFLISGFSIIFWLNVLLSNTGVISPWFTSWMVKEVHPLFGIFYVLSYPLWFAWGAERSFQLFGHSPEEGGVLWPFTLKEKSEPFKPSWKE